MQIRRLRLTNFRQHAETVLDFEAGLTGIVGPNGAGKSTLLEAIAWAMYGTSAARGTRDSIRRRSAPPRSRVEVELDFDLGAHRYRVVRSLQTAALFQDGEAAPIANSGGAVTGKVTRLLGMSRDEFFNTYFTGQKELAIMASMSAPERARFLSRVLGYERLAAVQVKLKDERTAVRASLQTAETGLADPAALAEEETAAEARVERTESELEAAGRHREATELAVTTLTPEWTAMQLRREEVAAIESELGIADHSVIEARNRCEALDRELAESLEARAKAAEQAGALTEWDGLIAARERLDAEAMASSGRRALVAQIEEVRAAVGRMDGRLAELPDPARLAKARIRVGQAQHQVAETAEAYEARRTEWVREQNAETEREGLSGSTRTSSDRRPGWCVAAGPSTTYPTCKPSARSTRPFSRPRTKLLEILSEGRHYSARIKQLAAEPDLVVTSRKAHEAAETDLKKLTTEVGRIEEAVPERTRLEQARGSDRPARDTDRTLAETPSRYDEASTGGCGSGSPRSSRSGSRSSGSTPGPSGRRKLVPWATAAEQELTRMEAPPGTCARSCRR
ncbi:MAG: SMC family ATPase [Gemmatimonadales bacterium]